MAVTVSGIRGIDRRLLARKARAILDEVGLGGCELSVLLTDDAGIRRLNREYRKRDRATDVLSFSLREGRFGDVTDALGDVVISLETAGRQAEEHGFGFVEEVDRLLVHGILHLVGYDHELSPRDARRMQRKAQLIGRRLKALFVGSKKRSRATG